jgi:hypothetical protein
MASNLSIIQEKRVRSIQLGHAIFEHSHFLQFKYLMQAVPSAFKSYDSSHFSRAVKIKAMTHRILHAQ